MDWSLAINTRAGSFFNLMRRFRILVLLLPTLCSCAEIIVHYRLSKAPADFVGDLWCSKGLEYVHEVQFSPDGKYVVAACTSSVRVLDIESGSPITTFGNHGDLCWKSRFIWIPFAAIPSLLSPALLLEVCRFTGAPVAGYISTMDISPDSRRVATGGVDGTVRINSIRNGWEIRCLRGSKGSVSKVSISPDGTRLVENTDNTILAWNVLDGAQIWRATVQNPSLKEAHFLPDGTSIMARRYNGTLDILDATNGKQLRSFPIAENASSLTVSQNGKKILVSTLDGLIVYDLETGSRLSSLEIKGLSQTTWYADEEHVLAISRDWGSAHLAVIHLPTKSLLYEIETDTADSGLNSLALSPDNRVAALGYFGGAVRLWKLPDLATLWPATPPSSAPIPPTTQAIATSRATPDRCPITSFSGRYRFLSNFFPAIVVYDGISYPTAEHAYQSAKTLDMSERRRIAALPSPSEAKRAGRLLPLRPDWEQVSLNVLEAVARDKFNRSSGLARQLLATEDNELIEGNTWKDHFWVNGDGHEGNRLGRILMKVRADLQDKEPRAGTQRPEK